LRTGHKTRSGFDESNSFSGTTRHLAAMSRLSINCLRVSFSEDAGEFFFFIENLLSLGPEASYVPARSIELREDILAASVGFG
jgi:hypothetical protein